MGTTKWAVVFPGQGAQAVGMGRDLADAIPACRKLFDKANEVLGFDLARLCFEGPLEELTKSDNAQPAIFVVSIACFRALQERVPDFEPGVVAGLSSGEWAALHVSGGIAYEDALRVLQVRGRFMQEACEVRRGTMLSVIGLSREQLEQVAQKSGMEIANLNSPEQTVLSGPVEAAVEAERLAKELGAKRVIPLNVAGAFHSSLMQPAAEKLRAFLQNVRFSEPRIPVFSNVTGEQHRGPEEIRELMIQQVTASVRWVDCVENMARMGVTGYLECGPGKVLSGLIRRIDKNARVHNIQDLSSLEAFVNEVQQ